MLAITVTDRPVAGSSQTGATAPRLMADRFWWSSIAASLVRFARIWCTSARRWICCRSGIA
jgi:hypothetical protein